ncbi:3-dehydroquinate synthase [Kordiimonas aquimaris]|uniref:3-dehydroquinate synthase n=1 Tax=Kordiimonas aquimaris TaxID=707591 RepID=UPI0021D37D85|nr:3-dehydroquinate synthase [Kordiimonas aquimaris]
MPDTQDYNQHNTIQTVPLALGDRSYDILVGTGLLDIVGEYITPLLKQPRVFIVTEKRVFEHQGNRLKAALESANIDAEWFTLEAGEATKSFEQYQSLACNLLEAGIERSDTILAFGGGVIGDLAGFAASSLLRGINFIQIPTTLLAQVDSSVGGKTGINTPFGKNLIGAFYQPKRVIIDTTTLNTLPLRELQAGYAEVVKYGLIDDPAFFTWLEENYGAVMSEQQDHNTRELRIEAITHCCRAKARIVAADEREKGQRALLNLGHTFGHALEAECGYDGTILHGEAVAIGMIQALETSMRLGTASTKNRDRVVKHFKKIGMKTSASEINRPLDAEALLQHMFKDKKVEAGKIGFILGDIGSATMQYGVDLDIIRSVLHDSIHAPR